MESEFAAPRVPKPKKQNEFPPLPYKDPTWAGHPQDDYYFEVIKQGSVLGKSGRISTSKVVVGACFLYDLGSSHGTFLNKTQIEPKKYVKINVGNMIRFGASSRIYIFQGPEQEIQAPKAVEPKEEKIKVSWYPIDRSLIDDNAYYYKDPKKALKVFLEDNDAEMEITCVEDDEDEPMKFIAKLEITGLQGPFEASGRGKKKGSAERDACLEACAKLDRMKILKVKSLVESASEKIKRLKQIYGDDEEDEGLYDKTEAANGTNENDSEDELDKYMSEINVKMSTEARLKKEKEANKLRAELANTDKLLKIATPQSDSSLLYSSVVQEKKVIVYAEEFVKESANTLNTSNPNPNKRAHEQDEEQATGKQRKRASMVPTKETMQQHYDSEDVVDVVYGKSDIKAEDLKKLQSSYDKLKFTDNEEVLCFHGPLIYDAKILKAEYWENRTDLEDGGYYFIHYKGWKPSWDEWVPEERIFKFTEENKQRQLELRASMTAKQHKAPAEKKIIDTAAKDRKRRRESIADKVSLISSQEDDYLKKPEIKISVPESLKSQLVEDWEQVTKNQKLLPLPAETPIVEILDSFFTHYRENGKRKKDGQEDSMHQVVEGLKVYFEKALGSILLYRNERQQYIQIQKNHPDKSISEIYGVHHLLRLFGKILSNIVQLPTLIAHTNMDQEAVNILKDHFSTFLLYLQENQESLFNVDYEAAIPEYLSK
ncbi:Esa1p-associated factor [Terramyces sp. JEL0728]|nr:Esa1p-associated factor [Terramyces sp. JEL0728]